LPRRDEILKAIEDPVARHEVLQLRGSEAARFGSVIHRVCQHFLTENTMVHLTKLVQYVANIPDGDPNSVAILRLLQDLCSASGELPSDYWLKKVSIKWERCVGNGGEALVYLGMHKRQHIVARKVMLQDCSSADGKETLAVECSQFHVLTDSYFATHSS
jgi:hypothetical protein